MSDEPQSPPPSPSSWRDVYQLVQDVERRLTQHIDDAVNSLRASTTDHEVRLRTLETTGSQAARTAIDTAAATSLRVTALEAANIVKQARSDGRAAIFSNGQKLVATTVVVCNFIVGAIVLLHIHG